jgi:light-regulated signal transduction histidine kinase (bacteriophytochrome)
MIRLHDASQSSNQLVADAAHELRTPFTLLRGELELLVRDPLLRIQHGDRLGSLLEEVERLSKIVAGILVLSRLDAGDAQEEWVTLDLGQLAVSTADQMALLAEDKKISLTLTSAPGVLVDGNRARLKEVAVNLLDNAINQPAWLSGGLLKESHPNAEAGHWGTTRRQRLSRWSEQKAGKVRPLLPSTVTSNIPIGATNFTR